MTASSADPRGGSADADFDLGPSASAPAQTMALLTNTDGLSTVSFAGVGARTGSGLSPGALDGLIVAADFFALHSGDTLGSVRQGRC
ncbi:hypothetical protein [Paracoccus sp. S1E-3]|uniref:hypothetical protein n=1 Tax=Paracoccus sp. S1E-3 TaxID=2756130 RepID=UPI0015EF0B9A|nr:hypothetical protein [Paracoccus sp. S1E-3]MBA4489839.1 hypothetical protein [Paracoccus sp. S1E-3]